MPAKTPAITNVVAENLVKIGRKIRAQRKHLHINLVTAAEAAGMSRFTLHRIELGKPSVTIGAYMNALNALGLKVGVGNTTSNDDSTTEGLIPVRIRLTEYPQLRKLAWQVHSNYLKPIEAMRIYERNWRHIDPKDITPKEQRLVDALRKGLVDKAAIV